MPNNSQEINVEVAYSQPDKLWLKKVTLPAASSIRHAIVQSGIMQHIPNFAWEMLSVGIFSQRATLTTKLKNGDRVEIYRELLRSANLIRQERAAAK